MNNCKEQYYKKIFLKVILISFKHFFCICIKYVCNIIYLENVFFAKIHLYNLNMIQQKLA